MFLIVYLCLLMNLILLSCCVSDWNVRQAIFVEEISNCICFEVCVYNSHKVISVQKTFYVIYDWTEKRRKRNSETVDSICIKATEHKLKQKEKIHDIWKAFLLSCFHYLFDFYNSNCIFDNYYL